MAKRTIIKIIVLLTFSLIPVRVFAQSASCIYYENQDASSARWSFSVEIDSSFSAQTKLHSAIDLNHLLASTITNLFLKNDVLHCPKYARLKEQNGGYGTRYEIIVEDGTGYTLSYGYKSLTRDDESYIEYDGKKYYYDDYPNGPVISSPDTSTTPETTIVNECPYGETYTFTISSDGTVSGYRSGYIVTIYDTKKLFTKDYCPKEGELFIETGTRDGKYYADVYTEKKGGTSTPAPDPDRHDLPIPDKLAPTEIAEMSCTSLFGDPGTSGTPAYYLTFAFKIARYIAIVLLVVLSIIDFIESTASQDQDSVSKAINKAIKRLVLCVIIFLLPSMIEFILTLLNNRAANICINY